MREQFILKANKKFNNKFDYSKVNYQGAKTRVIIICPEHGEFEQSPTKHLTNKFGCQKCAAKLKRTKLKNSKQFIAQANKVHANFYDYSKTKYIGAHDNVTVICPLHGEFEVIANNHLQGVKCFKCNGSQLKTTEEFINDVKQKFPDGNFSFDNTVYVNNKIPVELTCAEHGNFTITPAGFYRCAICCPRCANNGTSSAEQELQDFIESLDVKIENNNRSILAGKELDIYIPSKNIAIEHDGLYWHSDKFKDKKYHLNKTEQCEKQNIQLIHIFEDEWCTQRQIVKNRLKSLLGKTKYSVFARKCEVREIDAKLKNKFLNKYHIQGEDKSKIKLGLFYKERLVAVMTFGKSRFNKNVEWELIRYCTIANFRILGGAGKLLKHFERAYKPTSIISYADRRWSQGKVYKQLGFTHAHNSSPNYFYTRNRARESRHKFMKHKLKDSLKIFNPELSEVENMKLNCYYRIFDSGNMAFIKNY